MPDKPRLLFVGALWRGSTALQRCRAFAALTDRLVVESLDTQEKPIRATLIDRIRHRLRLPADRWKVNERLRRMAHEFKPSIVFVDSCRVLNLDTLHGLRSAGVSRLAFYTPDNAALAHNSSRQLERSYSLWDVFFTTKSFLVAPLAARGIRKVVLAGNAFDPSVHRPLTAADVGNDYERFDVVLVGTYEKQRATQIVALAEAGLSVVIYGNGWDRFSLPPLIERRPAVYEVDYARALHTAKLALCPLRQLNGDLITTRSIEIPACGRPMLGEKSTEHDAAFVDGVEYQSYASSEELCSRARMLLGDPVRRQSLAEAGRQRALNSDYSTIDRSKQMLEEILL